MTSTNLDIEMLSGTARRLLELKDEVFALWERVVRGAVPEIDRLRHPILIDTLPIFYEEIVQQISLHQDERLSAHESSVAAGHGSERAHISAYSYEALIREYQELRIAIYSVLHKHNVSLTYSEGVALNAVIDAGIGRAVTAFSKAHCTLREQFAAALTHDLRGPLETAYTGLELIVVITDIVKIKTLAAKSLESLKKMDSMICELLDTMAFHGGANLHLELTHFDMCELIKEVHVSKSFVQSPHAASS